MWLDCHLSADYAEDADLNNQETKITLISRDSRCPRRRVSDMA